ENQLKNLASPETSQVQVEKQALVQARLQGELELGINFLDLAQTYVESNEAAKRGDFFKKAIETLSKLSSRDNKNPICLLARTWLGRCSQENEDPKAARKIYNEVIAESGDHTEPAKRLARYFRLATLAADVDPKKAAADIRRA